MRCWVGFVLCVSLVMPTRSPGQDNGRDVNDQASRNFVGHPYPGGKPWGYLTFDNLKSPAANMEPVVPHPEQEKLARAKLKQFLKQNKRRPNILVFLTDDVGWMDFGPYGGGAAVGSPTPHINRLARNGLVLTSCYAQPTCSPTRATIHTGQLPVHHGILSPPMYGSTSPGLNPITALPQRLHEAGYTTQGVGKWHLGERPDAQPQYCGYDHYYGFLSVSDMYTEWRDPYFNPEVANNPRRYKYMQQAKLFDHHLIVAERNKPAQNVELIDLETIQTLDQKWTNFSVDFIRKQQSSKKPFFLYHATRGAHFDNYPSKKFRGRSPGHSVYTDTICELDKHLGRLVAALKETGQLENTLVIVTSDNGPEDEIPPHARTPFRGGKGNSWEGGVRVPAIAHWPGMIEPGRSDGLFDLADLYTTFISLAGGALPPPPTAAPAVATPVAVAEENAGINPFDPTNSGDPSNRYYIYGIDQTSFLLAPNGRSHRRSVLYWTVHNFAAARMDEFKCWRAPSLELGLHKGNYGGLSGVRLKTDYLWLFNLYDDPQEENNIFIRHLWCSTLFREEFSRFFNLLKQYPPNPLSFPAVGAIEQRMSPDPN